MNVSANFLQQVRDECYNKSLRCLEATDFIGEHQEIPIINFCKGVADELDKQAYMKSLTDVGLKNIPSNRNVNKSS